MSDNTSAKPFNDEDKIHLFLAYFGLLSLIPFFMFKDKKDDPQKEYVYWHARQGLALSIAIFVLCIVIGVISFIPLLGWAIGCLSFVLIPLVALGGSIMGWIKAFGGEKWEIPGISKLSNMLG